MTYLEKAINDGFILIDSSGKHEKVIYNPYNPEKRHEERYSDPEEKVRAEFYAELIYRHHYKADYIGVEITIPDRTPSDKADLVIFRDIEWKRPYAVIECKQDGITDTEFLQAVEQAFGNAHWQKLSADYVMVVAGSTRRVFDCSNKYANLEREQNIVADLPIAYGKPREYRFYKGDPNNDIQKVSKDELRNAIRKCHQTLWGGGRLSPPVAFGELCKIIFIKVSDEKKPRKDGEPYEVQIKTNETAAELGVRIRTLYEEQKRKDPEVFSESIKIDDSKLRTVISHIESINLNETDLDTKGVAFEEFMDSFFKGDFGQFFTPREIVDFVVKMMRPDREMYVLDPACGSGGFLLHALDRVRSEADQYYPDKKDYRNFSYWHDFARDHLFGIEINEEIARVAKMNMIVHDDGHTNVICFDALERIDKISAYHQGFEANKFDMVLTNPPFGSIINLAEHSYLPLYELGNTIDAKGKKRPRNNQKSEILFIERIWQFLKPGTGKAAVVLPDGVLTNSSMQYVRDYILNKFQLLAVVSLPQTAFTHYNAGVKSSIVFLRKRAKEEKPNDSEAVFMASPEKIGYDATGRKCENQLDDVVSKYREFEKDPRPFFQ